MDVLYEVIAEISVSCANVFQHCDVFTTMARQWFEDNCRVFAESLNKAGSLLDFSTNNSAIDCLLRSICHASSSCGCSAY